MRFATSSFVRVLVVTAAIVPLAGGCRDHAEPPPAPAATSAASTSAASTAAAGASAASASDSQALEIKDADGKTALRATADADGNVEIRFPGDGKETVLHGDEKESGKRKYRIGNGPVFFEVKPSDKGFKIRMADGALRWKVKLHGDSVDISNNEENDKPYTLAVSGSAIAVTAPGGRPLGTVTFDRARGRSTVRNAAGRTLYTVDAPSLSVAYAVPLLEEIPETQRDLIVAELVVRRK